LFNQVIIWVLKQRVPTDFVAGPLTSEVGCCCKCSWFDLDYPNKASKNAIWSKQNPEKQLRKFILR